MYGRDNTFGGYSDILAVSEAFVLKIPEGLAHDAAAPILCAGVTTYSPLKHWGVKSADVVGIVGLGGLGHRAVKLAKAMGATVTVFTSSKDRRDDALSLGAAHVFLEGGKMSLEPLAGTFDFILSTVPEKHDLGPFVTLLKRDKTVVTVGPLEPMKPLNNMEMAMMRKSTAGSLIGSLAETQEVLDFCAAHGVAPEIQLINIDEINAAYKKVEAGDVRFRYVVNMASLKAVKERL